MTRAVPTVALGCCSSSEQPCAEGLLEGWTEQRSQGDAEAAPAGAAPGGDELWKEWERRERLRDQAQRQLQQEICRRSKANRRAARHLLELEARSRRKVGWRTQGWGRGRR